MTERVIHLRAPREFWVGGLTAAVLGVAAALIWSVPEFVIVSAFGLLVACFPLLARLDAVKLDGPHLSVRSFVRWVGPVDLARLEALIYVPQAARQPALWLLVQPDVGKRFKRRQLPDHEMFDPIADRTDLRVVQVAAGGSRIGFPELTGELAQRVLPSDALVDPHARARLRTGR